MTDLTLPKGSQGKGRWAEQLAERWLTSLGLTPCTKNYRRRLGEIDLVLRDEAANSWVFVEVKYRSAGAKVSGIESITTAKQRKLYRTAQLFLQRVSDSGYHSNVQSNNQAKNHSKVDEITSARIDVVVITQHQQESTQQAQSDEYELYDYQHRRLGRYNLLWIQNAIHG